jgi:hypothetical protein
MYTERRACAPFWIVVKENTMKTISITVPLALAACVSPEQPRAQDEANCRSYGFQPGSPDFATCLQRESLARNYYQGGGTSLGLGFGFGGGGHRW